MHIYVNGSLINNGVTTGTVAFFALFPLPPFSPVVMDPCVNVRTSSALTPSFASVRSFTHKHPTPQVHPPIVRQFHSKASKDLDPGLNHSHNQEWSLRLNLTQHGKTYQVRT